MDPPEIAYAELPWLATQMAALRAAQRSGRLSHAVLVHAPDGAGGEWLAAWIARLVLCDDSAAAPCGICTSCLRVLQLQHPDLLVVAPEEDSRQIRIEQIRGACQELTLTSHQGRGKVAVISPADALNPFAANALLKTLEEPTPSTVIVLVAAQPSRLPATLRSRCQHVRVAAPQRAASKAWLEATVGRADWDAVLDTIGEAPLRAARLDAKELVEVRDEVRRALEDAAAGRIDPVATAERWSRSAIALRLDCIERWLTERAHGEAPHVSQSREVRPGAHLQDAASLLNIRALFGLVDGVREMRSLLDTSLNKSLALEALLRRVRDLQGARSAAGQRSANRR